MILGSHNSWSFKTPTKWWMKLLAFTARCQDLNIKQQYELGVRCFDLRLKFKKDVPIIAHGIIVYGGIPYEDLEYLNSKKDVYIRIVHEVRNEKQYTANSIANFIEYCYNLSNTYKNITFWYGRNLYNSEEDYHFVYNPSCREIYSSICSPRLIDDWYPRWFAKNNNKNIDENSIQEDILLIDFVNYGRK